MTPSVWASRRDRQNLPRDVRRALFGEVARLTDRPVERDSLQVLHRHVIDVVLGSPVVEDHHRVRVTKLRRHARFEEETLVKLRVLVTRVAGIEHLERADAAQGGLFGSVDLPHAALGDEGEHFVALVEGAADQRIRPAALGRPCPCAVRHRAAPRPPAQLPRAQAGTSTLHTKLPCRPPHVNDATNFGRGHFPLARCCSSVAA